MESYTEKDHVGAVNELERCEEVARYIVSHDATVRAAAKKFGISKSTVHKEVTARLKAVNHGLYREVREVLETNKAERHVRGGEATKQKYEKMRLQSSRAKI